MLNYNKELANHLYFNNPMEQFSVLPFSGFITNVTICFFITILTYSYFSKQDSFFFKNTNLYLFLILKLNILFDIFKNNLSVNIIVYLPTIFVIFTSILCANVCGMTPFYFTTTSLFVVTFFFAFGIIMGTTIIGVIEHKEQFLTFFSPPNSPAFLLPVLVVIEYISYIAKVFSLSIRLFANMTAGHMLLKILVGVSYHLFSTSPYIVFLLPSIVVFFIMVLEFGVAFLQAYIFAVLSVIYTDNALNLH